MQVLYDKEWKTLTGRFFADASWPTAREISAVVKDDRAFLVMYRTLFYNHVLGGLARSQRRTPSFAQYVEAWKAYKEFLEFAVEEPAGALAMPASWVYDTLVDATYSFEKFTELRLVEAGLRTRPVDEDGEGGMGGSAAPELGSVTEAEVAGAWGLADFLGLLHAAVAKADLPALLAAGRPLTSLTDLTGYNAAIMLCRLYSKLGDYGAALEAVKPLNVFVPDGAPYAKLHRAYISLQYYAAFALLMSRRYEDAVRVAQRTLVFFQRTQSLFGDRNGGEPTHLHFTIKRPGTKLLGILALAGAVLPGFAAEDVLRRVLRDRYGERTERIALAVAAAGDLVHLHRVRARLPVLDAPAAHAPARRRRPRPALPLRPARGHAGGARGGAEGRCGGAH